MLWLIIVETHNTESSSCFYILFIFCFTVSPTGSPKKCQKHSPPTEIISSPKTIDAVTLSALSNRYCSCENESQNPDAHKEMGMGRECKTHTVNERIPEL